MIRSEEALLNKLLELADRMIDLSDKNDRILIYHEMETVVTEYKREIDILN